MLNNKQEQALLFCDFSVLVAEYCAIPVKMANRRCLKQPRRKRSKYLVETNLGIDAGAMPDDEEAQEDAITDMQANEPSVAEAVFELVTSTSTWSQ